MPKVTLRIDKDCNVFDGDGNRVLPPYDKETQEQIDYHRLDILYGRLKTIGQKEAMTQDDREEYRAVATQIDRILKRVDRHA